mmetsp:Transcript_20210/g.62283  ORF Transcript_20210/g.62283 Transcript_20210/m.62283 type:complete len:232 (+) Transcript_20210:198-893(+)
MATHKLDYIAGGVAAPGRFVNTFPSFLEGRVSRQAFDADIEDINGIIADETKITRYHQLFFALPIIGLVLSIVGGFATSGVGISPLVIVGIIIFLVGAVGMSVGYSAHRARINKLMGTLIPAKLNEMAPRYGVTFNVEQDRIVSHWGGGGLGNDNFHSRNNTSVTYTYKIAITDEVSGRVVGVGPPPTAPQTVTVTAAPVAAPPAGSKFCTNCGAAVAPGARFCGSCGAAV